MMNPSVLAFPLSGICVAKRPPRHHRFALDLMVLSSAASRTNTGSRLGWFLGSIGVEHYSGWGAVVHSPGRGRVLVASDGREDRLRTGLIPTVTLWTQASFFFRPELDADGVPDIRPNVGNHLMIDLETSDGIAFYAHLRAGSIDVTAGDSVSEGRQVAALGNSGNTTAPHLHVHVLDQVDDLLTADLLPFVFSSYSRWTGDEWVSQTDTIPKPGEILRPCPVIEEEALS